MASVYIPDEQLHVTHLTLVCYLLYVCRSPSGGWWTQPTNWKANTAVAVGITATIVAAAWKYSAENEVSFPSHLFQENIGYRQNCKVSVDTHRKERPANRRAHADQWITALTRFLFSSW